MSVATAGWFFWFALFAVWEGVGLARNRGGTLSELIWRWLKVGDSRPTAVTWVWRVLVGLTLVWLFLHFEFRVLTPSHPLPW